MDSSKTIDAGTSEQSLRQQISSIDLDTLRAESLASIDRLATDLNNNLRSDIEAIQERVNKSFRQFLLDREQERMPFLQRVMTSHIENMEDERGFPPRHPVHWFKSKLEFSSTGILEFDFKKDAEVFIESSLAHIETEIKEQLTTKQQATIDSIDRRIVAMQQDLSDRIQPIARSRKIISTEYVNSFIQTQGLSLKAVNRFYFVSMSARFNSKQELLYSEVCVRPTGIFDRSKDGDKPTQLKYAISCDRLLDIVNESIARSLDQIQQQTQTYLSGELAPQVARLFTDLGASGDRL
jgi:uncharacterized membrane-anchored protein YhcB (DUF1043 family)